MLISIKLQPTILLVFVPVMLFTNTEEILHRTIRDILYAQVIA